MSNFQIVLTCNEPLCNVCEDLVIDANSQIELLSRLTEMVSQFSHYQCSIRVSL